MEGGVFLPSGSVDVPFSFARRGVRSLRWCHRNVQEQRDGAPNACQVLKISVDVLLKWGCMHTSSAQGVGRLFLVLR